MSVRADALPERPSDPPIVAGLVVEMCSAIPAASKHGWRTDVSCASHASGVVELGDRAWPVCRMHVAMWDRSSVERQVELARDWGWAS